MTSIKLSTFDFSSRLDDERKRVLAGVGCAALGVGLVAAFTGPFFPEKKFIPWISSALGIGCGGAAIYAGTTLKKDKGFRKGEEKLIQMNHSVDLATSHYYHKQSQQAAVQGMLLGNIQPALPPAQSQQVPAQQREDREIQSVSSLSTGALDNQTTRQPDNQTTGWTNYCLHDQSSESTTAELTLSPRDELWQKLQRHEGGWILDILERPVMVWGAPGSHKSYFAAFLLSLRMVYKNHQVEINDPHIVLNRDKAWKPLIAAGVPTYGNKIIGGEEEGFNYAVIAKRIDAFAERLRKAKPGKRWYSPLFDEVTQYSEEPDIKDVAGKLVIKSVSDCRKGREAPIILAHSNTLALTGGSKGTSKAKDEGLAQVHLYSTSKEGEFYPLFKGELVGIPNENGKFVSKPITLDPSWMSAEYVFQIAGFKAVESAEVAEIPVAPSPLNPREWPAVIYPGQLQQLPAHRQGVYAVFVGNQLVYIGESSDLWRRWNWREKPHHVRKDLDRTEEVVKIAFYTLESTTTEKERKDLETQLQIELNPPWNGTSKHELPAPEPTEENAPQISVEDLLQLVLEFAKERGGCTVREVQNLYRIGQKYKLKAPAIKGIFKEMESRGLGSVNEETVQGQIQIKFIAN